LTSRVRRNHTANARVPADCPREHLPFRPEHWNAFCTGQVKQTKPQTAVKANGKFIGEAGSIADTPVSRSPHMLLAVSPLLSALMNFDPFAPAVRLPGESRRIRIRASTPASFGSKKGTAAPPPTNSDHPQLGQDMLEEEESGHADRVRPPPARP
jgi:hypothetical protein